MVLPNCSATNLTKRHHINNTLQMQCIHVWTINIPWSSWIIRGKNVSDQFSTEILDICEWRRNRRFAFETQSEFRSNPRWRTQCWGMYGIIVVCVECRLNTMKLYVIYCDMFTHIGEPEIPIFSHARGGAPAAEIIRLSFERFLQTLRPTDAQMCTRHCIPLLQTILFAQFTDGLSSQRDIVSGSSVHISIIHHIDKWFVVI